MFFFAGTVKNENHSETRETVIAWLHVLKRRTVYLLPREQPETRFGNRPFGVAQATVRERRFPFIGWFMNTLVKIVIPFYRDSLEDWEEAALCNNMRVLSSRPVCFLKPEGLDLRAVERAYPKAEVLEVSPDWLGRKRGIAGYNEMMMSPAFYGMFTGCEYILVCHTDAWLFRDELDEWCSRGYDVKPWLCHELNRFRLPMGCHGFMHESRKAFWAQYIPCVE